MNLASDMARMREAVDLARTQRGEVMQRLKEGAAVLRWEGEAFRTRMSDYMRELSAGRKCRRSELRARLHAGNRDRQEQGRVAAAVRQGRRA